ncbi:MAG: hypothetical protein AAGA12_00485 [Pseudomonadota bacterium]
MLAADLQDVTPFCAVGLRFDAFLTLRNDRFDDALAEVRDDHLV